MLTWEDPPAFGCLKYPIFSLTKLGKLRILSLTNKAIYIIELENPCPLFNFKNVQWSYHDSLINVANLSECIRGEGQSCGQMMNVQNGGLFVIRTLLDKMGKVGKWKEHRLLMFMVLKANSQNWRYSFSWKG